MISTVHHNAKPQTFAEELLIWMRQNIKQQKKEKILIEHRERFLDLVRD